MPRFLLIGDVGPANVSLAIAVERAGVVETVIDGTFPSRGFRSLEDIVRKFMEGLHFPVTSACFSVAGPVVDEQVWFPNLDWCVDQRQVRETFKLQSVLLVNDLQATAMALPYLGAAQTATLQMGVPAEKGMRAVIATGMGLGEAVLVSGNGGYVAFPSEGGHADFAPNGPLQEELLAYLRGDGGHVSYERVCSGLGIPNLYRFLQARSGAPEPLWLAEELGAAENPTEVIIEHGMSDKPHPVCREALELFASILGAESGNLALRTLASGGVYVGGELAKELLPVLRGGAFLSAFRHKGTMSDLIRRIPVHVILEPRAALLGATRYALADAADPEPLQRA
jgi:glucokinase